VSPSATSAPTTADAPAVDGSCSRPKRADAQRNRAKIVSAAREAFRTAGDASLEGIARSAGVGIGTLYRNFPSRRALLEAVYVDEVEALSASAAGLADRDPWDALTGWLTAFARYVVTKHALVDEMMATMTIDDPVFRTCRDAIQDAGGPLLARAQEAGVVRPDLTFTDVIRMVGGITMLKNSTPEEIQRILGVALDGLRYRPQA
jgi:AcrR family transcriptional regulator